VDKIYHHVGEGSKEGADGIANAGRRKIQFEPLPFLGGSCSFWRGFRDPGTQGKRGLANQTAGRVPSSPHSHFLVRLKGEKNWSLKKHTSTVSNLIFSKLPSSGLNSENIVSSNSSCLLEKLEGFYT
jgi:hypothetical protein